MKKTIWILALLLLLARWAGAEPAPIDIRYVSVPVAEVHKSPSASSEQVTQALLWEPAQVTAERGRWCQVYIADQYFHSSKGYPGWMLKEQLQKVEKPATWWMVVVSKVGLREKPDAQSTLVSWAYLGSKLAQVRNDESSPEWAPVAIPGRPQPLWAKRASLQALSEIQRPSEGTPIVETASLLKGTPYLWGGMSSRGIDCSGLTYTSYKCHGYSIPRDADQQFEFGSAVEPNQLQVGDLLFFGKDKDTITHVGMFIGEGKFIQASSSLGGVTISNFDDPKFQTRFQGARRILK